MKKLIGLVCGLLTTGAAFAGFISDAAYPEHEPNNAPAIANFVGAFTPAGGAFKAVGTLGPGDGDVDWYSFVAPATGFITAGVYGDVMPGGTLPGDSTMQLLDSTLTELQFNDDGYLAGLGSNFVFTIPVSAGINYIGVSGYADGVLFSTPLDGIDDFSGLPHSQHFDYQLVVSYNPEPASMCLLVLGGLAALRRRR